MKLQRFYVNYSDHHWPDAKFEETPRVAPQVEAETGNSFQLALHERIAQLETELEEEREDHEDTRQQLAAAQDEANQMDPEARKTAVVASGRGTEKAGGIRYVREEELESLRAKLLEEMNKVDLNSSVRCISCPKRRRSTRSPKIPAHTWKCCWRKTHSNHPAS